MYQVKSKSCISKRKSCVNTERCVCDVGDAEGGAGLKEGRCVCGSCPNLKLCVCLTVVEHAPL